jgi:hypothetical protein
LTMMMMERITTRPATPRTTPLRLIRHGRARDVCWAYRNVLNGAPLSINFESRMWLDLQGIWQEFQKMQSF